MIVSRIKVYCLTLLLAVSVYAVGSEPIRLTNKDGKSIMVKPQSSTETEVTVKLVKTQKVYTLKLDSLDHVSQQKVKDWKKAEGEVTPDLELSYTSGKSSRTSKREQYDDKTLRLNPKVTVENVDRKRSAKDLSVTLLLLGTPVKETSLYYVFSKETKKVALIERGDSFVASYKGVKAEFDNKGYAQFGATYHGYVILVQNAKGEVVASKSIPSSLADKHGKKFLGLHGKKCYTKKLQEDGYRVRVK